MLGADLSGRGLEYLNTDLPTGTVYPEGESAFLLRTTDENAEELDRFAPGDGAAWRRTVDEFLPNADLSFGVLSTELYSRAGRASGSGPPAAWASAVLLRFVGASCSSRRATG